MSWNNTVTCSYCYRSGHNRRGCPDRRARLDEALLKPEEQREYADLNIIQEYERRSRDSRARKCTYCGKEGHNRRSCESLKAHIECVFKQEVAFRKAFVKHLNEINLNVGSLIVPAETDRGYIDDIPHLVTSIEWDNITVCQARQQIERFVFARPVNNLTTLRASQFTIQSPECWPTGVNWKPTEQRWLEQQYGLEVISGVSDSVEPPAGWFENRSKVKEFFKERELWQWPTDDNTYYSCEFWDLEKNQDIEKIA